MAADPIMPDEEWTRLGTARVAVRDLGPELVVSVGGEIDIGCAADVKREVLAVAGSRDVTVDLSGLAFLDSSGVRLLVELRLQARSEGRRLRFVDPQAQVVRLLDLTGLREDLLADG